MTSGTFVYDPSKPILRVNETRLNRLMMNDPLRCASVSEYAVATGMSTDQVIELFGPALDDGIIGLEIWGDEIFVMTAPAGRPAPADHPQVAPNLWEVLRESAPVEYAFALWRLVRGLGTAGWRVEVSAPRILFGLGPLRSRPYLGVGVGNTVVPVLVLPSPEQLSASDGLLAEYERAGAAAVAIVINGGALDTMVTAVRRWVLSRIEPPAMQILLLEAPRFNPTLLSAADAAVRPRAMSRSMMQDLDWGASAAPGANYSPNGGYGER